MAGELEHHYPRRGDDVEAWLKRERDRIKPIDPTDPKQRDRLGFYYGMDMLLDRYRECSDYGLTLAPEDDEKGNPYI